MSDNNEILDLAMLLSDKNAIRDDVFHTMNALTSDIREKYIKRIHAAAQSQKNHCISSPSKEVNLIRAIRAFYPPEARSTFDNMDRILTIMQAIQTSGRVLESENLSDKTIYKMDSDTTPLPPAKAKTTENLTQLFIAMSLLNMI